MNNGAAVDSEYLTRHGPWAYLTSPLALIAVFLTHKIYVAIQAFSTSPARAEIGWAIIVEVVVLLALAYLVHRGNRTAFWVVAIDMWLGALLNLAIVARAILHSQSAPLAHGLSYGVFLAVAGFLLLRSRIKKQSNKAL